MHTFDFTVSNGTTLRISRTKIHSMPEYETLSILEISDLNKNPERVVYSVVMESNRITQLLTALGALASHAP